MDFVISSDISIPFAGWSFCDGDLLDVEGNRYRPDDLKASFWLRQAWAARAGYPGELRFLRSRLDELILENSRPLLVQVFRVLQDGSLLLLSSSPVAVPGPLHFFPKVKGRVGA